MAPSAQAGRWFERWTQVALDPASAVWNRRAAFAAAVGCAALVVFQVRAVIKAVGAPLVAAPVSALAAPSAQAAPALSVAPGLFGVAEREPKSATPAVNPADLPDTGLGLTLTGILFDTEDAQRQAIVASGRGEQRTYRAGQDLEGVPGTKVLEVFPTLVVLQRGEVLETLRLPKQAPASNAEPPPATATVAVAGAPAQTTPVGHVVAKAALPTTSEVVRVVGRSWEGAFVGFAVSPGNDSAAFAGLGLQPEDIVTQVNGVALDGPDKVGVLFAALAKPGSVNIAFRRAGIDQSVLAEVRPHVSTPDDDP